jgi:hypothetical protein
MHAQEVDPHVQVLAVVLAQEVNRYVSQYEKEVLVQVVNQYVFQYEKELLAQRVNSSEQLVFPE